MRICLGSIAGAVGATAVYPIDLGMSFYLIKSKQNFPLNFLK
jgi:hypothetical protein